MADSQIPPLNPKLRSLLGDLRRRVRRYVTLETGLALVVVAALAFWIGFLVDWLPVRVGGTEMPRSARGAFLAATAVALAFVVVRFFLLRITRRLPDASLALLLERVHPQLGGRLITAVQLHRPRQRGDIYADPLLAEVEAQAIAAADAIEPQRALRNGPLWQKFALAAPLVVGLGVLIAASPATARLATQRLLLLTDTPWPRRAELRMVGLEVPLVSATESPGSDAVRLLEFEDKVVRVARGSGANLRIAARAEGAEVPEVCTLYYRSTAGVRGQVNMRRVGRVRDGFQAFSLDGPPLTGITEDLTLTIRGLDDRLEEYRIEVVDAPGVRELAVEATYPEYLRGDREAGPDLRTRYQPGLRMREGTNVRLVGTSSTPIARVDAAVTRGDGETRPVPVEVADDGSQFELALVDLRQPTTVVLVPFDANEISAPSPYRYFLGVVSDQPPEVQLRLRGIGAAVTPNVRMPLEGRVQDDYGVERLSIQLSAAGENPRNLHRREADIDRRGAFSTVIDVRDLANAEKMPRPQPGDTWNVFAEAEDAYDLGAPHRTRTDLVRLEVVEPAELLAVLERRELGLRARLEQTISEVEGLRETLDLLRREGWESLREAPTGEVSLRRGDAARGLSAVVFRGQAAAAEGSGPDSPETGGSGDQRELQRSRAVQLLRLRIQQAGLQAAKSSDELAGIAESINRILLEMSNNRVDTPDRSERMSSGVRDPLRRVVEGALAELSGQIELMLQRAEEPNAGPEAAREAVAACEQVLAELNAVLEKMLDLESYNEVLDLVRGLIEQQESLIESTKEEQGRALQDLFK
jgi:hypothetical protein